MLIVDNALIMLGVLYSSMAKRNTPAVVASKSRFRVDVNHLSARIIEVFQEWILAASIPGCQQ
jgi:hypothetical protein